MKKVVLISCVSKKLPYKSKAQDLYISTLFKLNLKYARSLNPDNIFILSAKYGLVDLEEEIEPYDKTLNTMPVREIKSWANDVIEKLKNLIDLNEDKVIFLAGEKYRKYLIPHIKNYEVPLKSLTIGRQLQFLTKKLSSE